MYATILKSLFWEYSKNVFECFWKYGIAYYEIDYSTIVPIN